MTERAKRMRKILSDLCDIAQERERNRLLTALANRFDDWRHKKITARELDAAIDEYHDEASKEIYMRYHSLNHDILVAQAVARDIVHESEVPEEIKDHVMESAEPFRSLPEHEWFILKK